jgi:hypothetical protein
MSELVRIYALNGYWVGEAEPSGICFAFTPQALPVGGWLAQGAAYETVEPLMVERGSVEYEVASLSDPDQSGPFG